MVLKICRGVRMFRYSCIYINRSCPRRCDYCREREAPLKIGRELTILEWKEVIRKLDDLGVVFNLFLGNDALLLGNNFLELVKFLKGRTDYAFYTTFKPEIFEPLKNGIAKSGIYNLSAGIDFLSGDNELGIKGKDGTAGLLWAKKQGIPDLQATLTLHKKNIDTCEEVVKFFSQRGIWNEINVVHWDLDGGFDFFPERMEEYALEDNLKLRKLVKKLVNGMRSKEYLIHSPPEYLLGLPQYGVNQSWHCRDTKIITIDADGTLRTCGYRPGKLLSEYTIFDLGNKISLEKYKELWKKDSQVCPGCYWAYTWFVEEFYNKYGAEVSDKVLQEHYYDYIT